MFSDKKNFNKMNFENIQTPPESFCIFTTGFKIENAEHLSICPNVFMQIPYIYD